ncbi:unnamed protein product [Discosporangium mesarthrocarpum]
MEAMKRLGVLSQRGLKMRTSEEPRCLLRLMKKSHGYRQGAVALPLVTRPMIPYIGMVLTHIHAPTYTRSEPYSSLNNRGDGSAKGYKRQGRLEKHGGGDGKDKGLKNSQGPMSRQMESILRGVRLFTDGLKLLWREILVANDLRRKKGHGEVLSRAEEALLLRVPRDVAKALPLVVFFAIPVIGYLAPYLGLRYPKTLLPAQFWSLEQRKEFVAQDAHAQQIVFPVVLQHVHRIGMMPQAPSDMVPKDLSGPLKSSDISDPDTIRFECPRYLAQFLAKGGAVKLEDLSNQHLQDLSLSINPMPPMKKALLGVIPRPLLLQWLHKEASLIGLQDVRILEDMLQFKRLPEGNDAMLFCWERGLLCRVALRTHADKTINTPVEESCIMQARMTAWLSMYNQEKPLLLPATVILHAPALLREWIKSPTS